MVGNHLPHDLPPGSASRLNHPAAETETAKPTGWAAPPGGLTSALLSARTLFKHYRSAPKQIRTAQGSDMFIFSRTSTISHRRLRKPSKRFLKLSRWF
jgi:hypothetical protein